MSVIKNIQTFESAPVMSGASITAGTIPIASVVGTAMDLTTAQTAAGIKTFSSAPVMSGASITAGTIPIASVVGTAMDLTTVQTAAGVKTFSSGISTSAFTLSTAPVAGYVLTSDGSGVASWQSQGGGTEASVQTTDATPTTLLSVPVGANSSVTLSGTVTATDSAFGSGIGGSFNIIGYRAAGAASAVPNPLVVVGSTSAATWTATLSGNNLIVEVTGIAATTINWKVEYTTVIVS